MGIVIAQARHILWMMWKILQHLLLLSGVLSNPIARDEPNNGIHLAVDPTCGVLGGKVSDVNAGIQPGKYKTLVSFGV
jgi:hypothetical protein